MYACKSKKQKKLFLKETPVYEGVKGGYHHCFSWREEGGGQRGGKVDMIYEVEAKTSEHLLCFANENVGFNGPPKKCLIYAI